MSEKLKLEYKNKYSFIEKLTANHVSKIKNKDSIFLDAGGGKYSKIDFDDYRKHILDISDIQLSLNKQKSQLIKADIELYIREDFYDIILCYDVLEHLKNPNKAISNMLKSLKKGGVLVIGSPNPSSFWGLITKYSPYFIHQFFYRFVIGSKKPNKETGPFVTYLKKEMRHDKIINNLNKENFKVIHLDVFEGFLQKLTEEKITIFKLFAKLIRNIYPNLLKSNYILLIEKLN